VFVLPEGEALATCKVTPDKMTVFLIQVKCLKDLPSERRMAALCSTELPRSGSTAATHGNVLNNKLDYISMFLQVRQSSKTLKCMAFSRKHLKDDYGITGDPKQISIAVSGLQPSHVLGKLGKASINSAFDRMMVAKFDPLNIEGSTPQAKKNLAMSLGLVYS
jgi:hypothetical protein